MNPSDADTGPLAQVDCRRDADGWTLAFVRELPQPPERVWDVLTDPARLRAWSPYTADRNLGQAGDGGGVEDHHGHADRGRHGRLGRGIDGHRRRRIGASPA